MGADSATGSPADQGAIAPFPRKDGKRTPAVPRIDWARSILVSVSLLCCLAAIMLAAYPFLSDRIGAWRASQSFSEQLDACAATATELVESATIEALAYNEALAGKAAGSTTSIQPYDEQLSIAPDGTMCWIEIPRIGVKEPVYRGADENELDAALMMGAAHVRGTSLPVGGASSNTVITGHTGMRDTRMFDQLDNLQEGDIVILWTLGQPYAYEVTGTELVTPDRSDVMGITSGEDQCTLVTCRNPASSTGFLPTGSYSHRLIVHSRRTDWSPALQSGSSEYFANPRTALFGGSILASGALLSVFPWVAFGMRRSWTLDRIVGKRTMTPQDVTDACGESGDAHLRLASFGRARLDLFGERVKGRWSRVKGDRSRIRLRFPSRAIGIPYVLSTKPLERAVLPHGTFEACAFDDELGMTIDFKTSTLVFTEADRRKRT